LDENDSLERYPKDFTSSLSALNLKPFIEKYYHYDIKNIQEQDQTSRSRYLRNENLKRNQSVEDYKTNSSKLFNQGLRSELNIGKKHTPNDISVNQESVALPMIS
jgi:hypothetical protein